LNVIHQNALHPIKETDIVKVRGEEGRGEEEERKIKKHQYMDKRQLKKN
jgi:hypothetical protein